MKDSIWNIIIDLQKSYTWKTQLTIPINFISSKGIDKEGTVHSKSDNIEVTGQNYCRTFWITSF